MKSWKWPVHFIKQTCNVLMEGQCNITIFSVSDLMLISQLILALWDIDFWYHTWASCWKSYFSITGQPWEMKISILFSSFFFSFSHVILTFKTQHWKEEQRLTVSEIYSHWLSCFSVLGLCESWLRVKSGPFIVMVTVQDRDAVMKMGSWLYMCASVCVCVCSHVVSWEGFIERTRGSDCGERCWQLCHFFH